MTNQADKLVWVGSQAILQISEATAALHLWYTMKLCFLDKVDSGILVFIHFIVAYHI